VSLRLYTEALAAVTQMVLDGTATIGVCGALDEAVAGIERIGVGTRPAPGATTSSLC
jgi:hypothetical protein